MIAQDEADRQFPILKSRINDAAEFVPWAFVERLGWKQIEVNHCGQSLAYLAQRGGLSWRELYAGINGLRPTEARPDVDHRGEVLKMVAAWEARQ